MDSSSSREPTIIPVTQVKGVAAAAADVRKKRQNNVNRTTTSSDAEPTTVVRVDRHDDYQAAKRESVANSMGSSLPTMHHNTEAEPTQFSRLDSHDDYKAKKRDSSLSDQQIRAKLRGSTAGRLSVIGNTVSSPETEPSAMVARRNSTTSELLLMAPLTRSSPPSKNTASSVETDHQIKAGLRNSRVGASTMSVGAISMDSSMTSSSRGGTSQQRSSVRTSQVEADNQIKAGLRNSTRNSVMHMGSSLQSPPSQSDTQIKAGLRNSRPSVVSVGARSVSIDTTNSEATDADARIKAGLRNSRPSVVSDRATSVGSAADSDARVKAGLRSSQVGASTNTMVGATAMVGATPVEGEEAQPNKAGLRNNRSSILMEQDSRLKHGLSVSSTSTSASTRKGLRGSMSTDDKAAAKFNRLRGERDIAVPMAESLEFTQDSQRSMKSDAPGDVPLAHVEAQTPVNVQPVSHRVDEEQESQQKKKRRYLWWIILVVLVVVIGSVVGVVLGTQSSGSETRSDTVQTAIPPTTSPNLLFQLFPTISLPPDTITAVESQRERLPQVQAYNWLVEDPNVFNYTEPQRLQRFALAAFYFSTNGPEWFEDDVPNNVWLDYDTHECEWFSLASTQGHAVCQGYTPSSLYSHYDYTALVLSGHPNSGRLGRKLKGRLVPELALLKELVVFDLGFQDLRGTIPTELEQLSSTLRRIVLYENDFTGTIPQSLFSFGQDLWFSKNQFDASTIPTTVGLNSNLQSLLLVDCRMTGTIPSQLFHPGSKLMSLLLELNQLEGPIPTQIGLAASLSELNLSKNRFSDTIPTELGQIPTLRLLDSGSNQLMGTLPTELGNLQKLTTFAVHGNRLEGNVPTEFGKLRQLRELKLSWIEDRNRGLSGDVPSQLFTTASPVESNGVVRSLQENGTDVVPGDGSSSPLQVTEAIPTPPFPFLQHLWIEDTDLSLELPTELGWMSNLKSLRLGWNKQTPPGTIPSELGLLSNTLTELSLASIKLQSTIPAELGQFRRLTQLLLQDNALTGDLSNLAALGASLDFFEVHGNAELGGSVPSTLCDVAPRTLGCDGDVMAGAGATSLCGCHCGTCT